MKIFSVPIVVFLTTLFFISCRKDLDSKPHDQNPTPTDSKTAKYSRSLRATRLGKEIPNYYKPDIINKAIAKLKARQSARATDIPGAQPNFYYVRFLPATEEELMELIDQGLDLYEEPLHFEIEELGETYHDPSIPEDEITWMYTIVPIDYQFPPAIEVEIISEEFLFNTEWEEEEEDELEDSYAEEGSPYACKEAPAPVDRIEACTFSRRNQIMNDAYQWLVANGINPEDLEDEAMSMSGYSSGTTATARLCSKRYPRGRITVEDNNLGTNVPVKGVMVKARNFLKLKRTYTDVNGSSASARSMRRPPLWSNSRTGTLPPEGSTTGGSFGRSSSPLNTGSGSSSAAPWKTSTLISPLPPMKPAGGTSALPPVIL